MQKHPSRPENSASEPVAWVPANARAEEEIGIRDIVVMLGRRKRLMGTILVVCTVLGLVYALFTQPLYSASVIVRPISEESSGTLSSLRGRFGGVAALAGIDLGADASDVEEFIAILESRNLGERFINEYGLKAHLFPERWDAEAQQWKTGEPGFIGQMARGVSQLIAWISGDEGWRQPMAGEPSEREAYKLFSEEVRNVSEDRETGIVTVSFEFRDPELAAEWANALVAMANASIRRDAVREASRALEYLNREAASTSVSDLRQTIFSLIEVQLERIALANSRPEYAFKVLDPAVVPEERSHPRRSLIVTLSLVLGGMLGVLVALTLEVWKGGIEGDNE